MLNDAGRLFRAAVSTSNVNELVRSCFCTWKHCAGDFRASLSSLISKSTLTRESLVQKKGGTVRTSTDTVLYSPRVPVPVPH